MKLCYFKARNVLSFGDEEVELEFSPFSVIAGPNDSGKTNLFRALSLIEKAFDYGKITADDILFQGDTDLALHLEVGVELDDTELELLATLIICSEMARVLRPETITKGITENKHWNSILTNYGYAILSKSLRHLSFVVTKNELRTSDLKIVVRLSDENRHLYLTRNNYLAENSDIGNYSNMSLAKEIIEDFTSRFGNPSELEVNSLIQDIQKLSDESPTLIRLLEGKISGVSPNKVVELRGGEFNEYVNILREKEPILLTKLYQLFERRGIQLERLYVWKVLEQIYKTSFVKLPELRLLSSNSTYVDSGQDSKSVAIIGSDLARKLFWLMSSATRKNREKYNRIKKEFEDLTGAGFDIAVREKEIEFAEEKIGVFLTAQQGYGRIFTPLDVQKEKKTQKVNETFIQIIKDNYPVPIDQAASGLYEILFLLTAVIGESGKILLLDEPELHLHPTMQKRILNLLSEFRNNYRNQIVLITHSPYLVSDAQIDSTWRFTTMPEGTKAHNLCTVLSILESKEKAKLSLKLSVADVRSILFSRGVILVEGLSDKIVVEQIDKFLSTKDKGARLDENEWSILDIGGKDSLSLFIILCRMLDVRYLTILDYDALMRKERAIELNGVKVKTSTVFVALKHAGQLEDSQSNANLLLEASNNKRYVNSHFKKLLTLAKSHGIFVFSSGLEGAMQSQKLSKRNKPLKAVELVLELINKDKIPSEFYSMCHFLKEQIRGTKSIKT